MRPEELLKRYCAWEPSTDRRDFQWRQRILQSLWRKSEGHAPGNHRGKTRGAQLAMPQAKDCLSNFLTPNIQEVVCRELDKSGEGKLYGRPRLYDNLLSSQPLCFNLFGELTRDLELATRALADMSSGRVAKVRCVDFEYSPGRQDPRYTGDSSAYDVFVRYETSSGGCGFAGIEVKYHESLKGGKKEKKHYEKHSVRYHEIAEDMACFRDTKPLQESRLQQIWRDHLLMGAHQREDGFEDAFFVFLYPEANTYCSEAVKEYRKCLSDTDSFQSWTLENLVERLMAHSDAEWIRKFRSRYLDFSRLDRVLPAS